MSVVGIRNRLSIYRESPVVIGLFTFATSLLVACTTRMPLEERPAVPQGAVFFDDFQAGETPSWDPIEGQWELREGERGLE